MLKVTPLPCTYIQLGPCQATFLLSMFDFAFYSSFCIGKKGRMKEKKGKKCIPYAYSEQMRSFDYSITTFLTKILNCDYPEYSWDTLLLPLKYKCRKRRALGKLGKLAALLSAMYYYVQYSTAEEPTNIPEYTCCLIPQSPRAFLQSFQFGRCFLQTFKQFP